MAGPVTHIVLAVAALNTGMLSHVDPREFIIGTSFPDIRYLGVIEREHTHDMNTTWRDVVNEPSSFKAGMKFHALVDRLREEQLHKSGIYTIIPNTIATGRQLKLVEDSLMYHQINSWKEIYAYFNSLPETALEYGITTNDLRRWHTFLQRYLTFQKWHTKLKDYALWKSSLKLASSIMPKRLTISNKTIHRLIDTTHEIEHNKTIVSIIQNLYRNFLLLLE